MSNAAAVLAILTVQNASRVSPGAKVPIVYVSEETNVMQGAPPQSGALMARVDVTLVAGASPVLVTWAWTKNNSGGEVVGAFESKPITCQETISADRAAAAEAGK
ncbi:MAG: hypothetical protein KY429_04870 [Actinobacteria bacterium]|nr:hypothetical protein [Actinomycetota bacterium]